MQACRGSLASPAPPCCRGAQPGECTARPAAAQLVQQCEGMHQQRAPALRRLLQARRRRSPPPPAISRRPLPPFPTLPPLPSAAVAPAALQEAPLARPLQSAARRRHAHARTRAAAPPSGLSVPGLDLSNATLPPDALTKAVKDAFRVSGAGLQQGQTWGRRHPKRHPPAAGLLAAGCLCADPSLARSLLTHRRRRRLSQETFWGSLAAPRVLDSFLSLQAGEELRTEHPGQGLQEANSFLKGLSAAAFPDPYGGAYKWLEALEPQARPERGQGSGEEERGRGWCWRYRRRCVKAALLKPAHNTLNSVP